jgi:predicted Zn-ribbon and HTH transcriptional regulator
MNNFDETLPPPDRIDLLTAEERAFAARLGLEHGVDDDDEDLHQGTHVCWPYESGRGALCKTSRLWGHTGPIGPAREGNLWQVDCEACAARLREIMRDVGPVADLLDALAGLAGACQGLSLVSAAAHDFCWALDNPEDNRKIVAEDGFPDPRKRLDEALAQELEAHAERMRRYTERTQEPFAAQCPSCGAGHRSKVPIPSDALCPRCSSKGQEP